MSLKNYSREELEVTSMIELANEILHEEKKAQNFNDLYNRIAEMKDFTEEQKQEFMAQFYTDLTIDGRFLTIESGVWGLKRWYPVEQMDEIVTAEAPKKKKKTKAKAKKKKEEVPREQPEEGDLDIVDDNVEILTNKFEDDAPDESDDIDDNEGFDDELDEADDDFDADEDDEELDDSDDEEDNKN
ncbi:DNA-directed RNA polymerase subunit delta [Lentibacillus salicampi]|uniref:Probable DNA-directed RNA polymerase subunit delta n=1 Tax=Lentibacillus salicampi TaxID=175306 RepID=A0A4Y9AG77_9BACI|nr:DNA-directed RNA polymerase subunit delta [Lentibacillus salicampi]TFJ93384.1 DNA-directed RNA polymerase subunit delta [Lentibacillus salicampi]